MALYLQVHILKFSSYLERVFLKVSVRGCPAQVPIETTVQGKGWAPLTLWGHRHQCVWLWWRFGAEGGTSTDCVANMSWMLPLLEASHRWPVAAGRRPPPPAVRWGLTCTWPQT